MRLFIAVPIPESLKDRVGEILLPLRRTNADYKWVEPRNLHLTLAFLGETPEDRIPEIEAAIGKAVEGRGAFELAFGEFGAFDSLERPRVLWLGAREGSASLKEIAEGLLSALREGGLLPEKEKDRPFSAHLTLGRMRSPRDLHRLKAALKSPPSLEGLGCRVDRLVLYESKLSPRGPLYREIYVNTLVNISD